MNTGNTDPDRIRWVPVDPDDIRPGDKLRGSDWGCSVPARLCVDVRYCDDEGLWGWLLPGRTPIAYRISRGDWLRAEPLPEPIPERWITINRYRMDLSHRSPERVDAPDDCVAVIHVWTDEDGVDHAEVERVDKTT